MAAFPIVRRLVSARACYSPAETRTFTGTASIKALQLS